MFHFVRGELGGSEDGVAAAEVGAVVVRLLAAVGAGVVSAALGAGVLLEAVGADVVELDVVLAVGHHLARVGAHERAAQAVEVGRLAGQLAVGPAAGHRDAELLELAAHDRAQPAVTHRVLRHARPVAEAVAAVESRAVEVRHALPVRAVRLAAVLVVPDAPVAVGDRVVLLRPPRTRNPTRFDRRRLAVDVVVVSRVRAFSTRTTRIG